MNAPNPPPAADLAAEFDATMGWWRAAGVDCDFADQARNWLAEAEHDQAPKSSGRTDGQAGNAPSRETAKVAERPVPNPAPQERVDLLGDDPPRDLAAFRSWWLEAPGLDAIGPRGRVPPRGTLGAALMVLVTDPEEGDRERLLDGPQGRLLAAFLAAAGLAESEVYLASSLPRHTPMADTVRLAAGGMDAVTLHHIALAAPQRVLALGTGLAPLIGHSTAQDISGLDNINHKGRSIPLMVSEGLESLIAMPRLKARLWRRWIEWSQDFTVQR